MRFYRYYGWCEFARWTNGDGTGGWIWGPIGIHIYRAKWLIRWLDKRDGIEQS